MTKEQLKIEMVKSDWFFQKKIDFRLIDENEIRRVEFEINIRPVRKFCYISVNEVILLKKVSVLLIS